MYKPEVLSFLKRWRAISEFSESQTHLFQPFKTIEGIFLSSYNRVKTVN